MNRVLKALLLAVAGLLLLVILAVGAALLFFDPNDFRDDISTAVREETGRELTIEGDLSIRVFPWLAVEVGNTRLGNAEGFGDEPFASFDSARLSIEILPLLLRREFVVGNAALDGLVVNLATNADGTNNWDDLAAGGEAPAEPAPGAEGDAAPTALDIAGIDVSGAVVRYRDAAAGSDYRIEGLTLSTGAISPGSPFGVDGRFDYSLEPDGISGSLELAATVELGSRFEAVVFEDLDVSGRVAGLTGEPATFALQAPRLAADLETGRLEPASLSATALGVEVSADVAALGWADAVTAETRLSVAPFSPRGVLGQLQIELPPTADPQALTSLALSAAAELDADSLSLGELEMRLDATTLTGEIVVPLGADAPLRFDLAADTIDLDRYMAPAGDETEEATADETADFEIPVDLVRSVNARGTARLEKASFAGMSFTGLEVGLTAGDGRVRLNPLSAQLFDGSYSGDIRIDAAGNVPALSMNERISDVSLTPLAQAMFEVDDVTGTIDGSFVLETDGQTLSAMQRNLDGNISFELADGAWEGVDIWHQLRTARALYRREVPPERSGPSRTEFSSVLATGTVTDGVFSNEDLMVEMPFLQLSGSGTVDLVEGAVDYALRARVLERPEFLSDASETELDEFTEALIPVRVRGSFADLSVRPDIEAMFRDEVEDALKEKGQELRQRLLDRLIPGQGEQPAEGEQATEEEQDVEDQLKDRLRKLLDQQ